MVKTIHTEEYKKVTENLKKARIEAGLTQGDVAKKMDKPQSYISKVENGEQRIDVIELNVMAGVYGKNLNYFLK